MYFGIRLRQYFFVNGYLLSRLQPTTKSQSVRAESTKDDSKFTAEDEEEVMF